MTMVPENLDIIFIIARMNPPHKGHLYLVNKAVEESSKYTSPPRICIILSDKIDFKNPLQCSDKNTSDISEADAEESITSPETTRPINKTNILRSMVDKIQNVKGVKIDIVCGNPNDMVFANLIQVAQEKGFNKPKSIKNTKNTKSIINDQVINARLFCGIDRVQSFHDVLFAHLESTLAEENIKLNYYITVAYRDAAQSEINSIMKNYKNDPTITPLMDDANIEPEDTSDCIEKSEKSCLDVVGRPEVSGFSATKLRNLAKEGKYDEFSKMYADFTDPEKEDIFKSVKLGLEVEELKQDYHTAFVENSAAIRYLKSAKDGLDKAQKNATGNNPGKRDTDLEKKRLNYELRNDKFKETTKKLNTVTNALDAKKQVLQEFRIGPPTAAGGTRKNRRRTRRRRPNKSLYRKPASATRRHPTRRHKVRRR